MNLFEKNKYLMKKVFSIILILVLAISTLNAAKYTVTNTNDNGAGSLRQAIIDANASGVTDTIQFAITGAIPYNIILTTPLPVITFPTAIDGYTQSGSIKPGATWPAKIMVQLQGSGNINGLEFATSAAGSSVKGLSVVGFGTDVDHAGIYIAAPNVTVAGNLIGLKTDGTALANSIGVLGAGADNVVVGGATPDCRNVISGNTYEGVTFIPIGANLDNFASGELVQNNYVGTNVYGTAAIGNGTHGVDFDGANNSSILDNVIGGSGQYGIGCDATYSTTSTIPKIHDVTIMRNRIGIGVNGEDIGNGKAGIMVINAYNIIIGSSVANANIICYNENGVVVLDYPAGTTSHTYDVAITYNRIYNNDNLGIDLSSNTAYLTPDGVTDNDNGDGDTGPNELQNFPVITEAYVKNGILTIKGNIDTDQANANIIIVFFRNPQGVVTFEPSGYGENYVRIGLIQVTTDANGDASFTANYAASTVAGEGQANYGDNIVAFSRGHNNQTSEYSKYYVVTAVPDSVCYSAAGTISYTVPPVEGATSYTWTVPSGATITTGQGTNTVSVNWSAMPVGSYELTVKANNSCGESTATAIPVVVYACSTDLAITKTANPNPVLKGGTLTYTLTVTNTGTNAVAAQNVVVNDVLDSRLTFVSATPSVGSWTAPNWTIGTLAAGATATLQLVTTVQTDASNPTPNTATVSSTTPDSNSANNTATTSTGVGDALSIACPAPVNVACGSSVPAHATDLTSFNAAGGTVAGGKSPYTVTWVSDVISNQTCANKYTLTRTYRATDSNTTPATQDCSQTITVLDNIAPTITCPPATTVECAGQIPAAATDYTSFVSQGGTASDNCTGAVTITHVIDEISNQTCSNRYTLTRTYRATDLCGNSTDCKQIITINDQTAPEFTTPANVNISCDASSDPDFTGRPVVTSNNCGTSNVTSIYTDVITPGTCDNNYSIARTWKVSDQCGNYAEQVQTITLTDNTDPVITCPGNQAKNNDSETCTYTAVGTEFDPVSATDNCGVKSVTYALTGVTTGNGSNTLAGVEFNKGVTTVTWTITDKCDKTATCNFTVTVTDNQPPAITCPPDINVETDSGKDYATVTALGTPVTSDNCGVASVTKIAPENNQYPLGTNTVTWTVTDVNGNSSVCSQIIQVKKKIEACEWRTIADGSWDHYSTWEYLDCTTNQWVASPVAPNNDKLITVRDSVSLTGAVTAKEVVIEISGSLTVTESLTITDQLIFKVDTDGKAGKLNNNGGCTGGTVTMGTNAKIVVRKALDATWDFISFPFEVTSGNVYITGTTTQAVWGDIKPSTSGDFYAAQYDGASRTTDQKPNASIGNYWINVTDHKFVPVRGYIVSGGNRGAASVDFIAAPNTQLDFCDGSYSPENYAATPSCNGGWCLVGTPYVSAYDLYYASPYKAYYVAPSYTAVAEGQNAILNSFGAFFMQATAADPVNYPTEGIQKARRQTAKYNNLELAINNTVRTNTTLVRLAEDANVNYQLGEDALNLNINSSAPQIYSEAFGACTGLAVNTLPMNTERVDLKVRIGAIGAYTIKLTNKDILNNIKTAILVDTETGLQTDLISSAEGYPFDATETGTSGRFYILLSPNISTILSKTGNEEIDVLIKGKRISLTGLKGEAGVKMYDVVGKLMYKYDEMRNGQSFDVNIPGVYLMDIKTETQNTKIKVLIKNK